MICMINSVVKASWWIRSKLELPQDLFYFLCFHKSLSLPIIFACILHLKYWRIAIATSNFSQGNSQISNNFLETYLARPAQGAAEVGFIVPPRTIFCWAYLDQYQRIVITRSNFSQGNSQKSNDFLETYLARPAHGAAGVDFIVPPRTIFCSAAIPGWVKIIGIQNWVQRHWESKIWPHFPWRLEKPDWLKTIMWLTTANQIALFQKRVEPIL